MVRLQLFPRLNLLKGAEPILKIFNSEMIVGKFGEDITPKFAKKLASCIFNVFESNNMSFVIGRDSLNRSKVLEQVLIKELSLLGCKVHSLGVTTSGAISFATNFYKATAGINITASARNRNFIGFKIFNGNGYAISDEQLSKLEFLYKNNYIKNYNIEPGEIIEETNFNDAYVNFLTNHLNFNYFPYNVAIDAGYGAGAYIAKDLASNVFKTFKLFGCDIDGENINEYQNIDYSCYDFYIKLSGDCDRLEIYMPNGKKIEGDFLIAFFARVLQKKNNIFTLVSNLYTNNAYFKYFDNKKIKYYICGVGEKRIVEKMLKTNSEIGGEKYGAFLNFNDLQTSDAFLTLINFFNFLCDYPQIFEEIYKIKINPQVIKKVALNDNFKSDKFLNVLSAYEALLENEGKIIVRQDKLNEMVEIFVECPNEKFALKICNNLISLV